MPPRSERPTEHRTPPGTEHPEHRTAPRSEYPTEHRTPPRTQCPPVHRTPPGVTEPSGPAEWLSEVLWRTAGREGLRNGSVEPRRHEWAVWGLARAGQHLQAGARLEGWKVWYLLDPSSLAPHNVLRLNFTFYEQPVAMAPKHTDQPWEVGWEGQEGAAFLMPSACPTPRPDPISSL